MVDVLVCIKRVPETSGEVTLAEDGQSVDARHVGYTLSSHDECAITVAVQIAEDTGGSATVLTLGPDDAVEQLRNAIAVGCTSAVQVQADSEAFGPTDVVREIATVVGERQASGMPYDLVLVGNDAADTGDFQVGVRLGYALERPVLTGISALQVDADTGSVVAEGSGPDGTEVFEIPLPAVVAVREGGVEPRYPSIPGRMKAKRTPVDTRAPGAEPVGSGRVRLKQIAAPPSEVQILGEGPSSAAALVDVLEEKGVLSR